MDFLKDMKVLRKGGDNLVSKKPFFSWDSKYLLLVCDDVVKVYSLAGSGCVQVLRPHGSQITSILQHPHFRMQVLLTDSRGVISCWSYEGGVMLWSLSCSCAIVCACISGGHGDDVVEEKDVMKNEEDSLAVHGVVDNKEKGFSLLKLVIARNNNKDTRMEIKSCSSLLEGMQSIKSFFRFGNHNRMLVYDEGVSSVKVHDLSHNRSYKHRLANRLKVCSIAASPSSAVFAVGTHSGAILLHPHATSHTHTTTTLHWHSLPLTALSFTTDGSSLLSGGQECVLMRWSLSNNSKHPLPRLPAPILHISPNPQSSLYALSLCHNGIELVSNTWKAVGNIQGMSVSADGALEKSGANNDLKDGEVMLVDQRASMLLLRGFHGRIQVYDVINDQHVYSVDVTQENYISPENLSQPVSCSNIDHVSLSKDGDWLLTGQSVAYEDGGGVGEVFLKFWRRSQDGSHTLRTIAKDPHRGRSISSISNNSPLTSHPYFVTMAINAHAPFIVWNLNQEEGAWHGTHILTHHNKMPSHLLSNFNGSALALIFQQTCVTFWDALTYDLTYKCNFPQPISLATFSRDLDCMYVTSSDLLTHWSPVLKEQWQRSSKVSCMCVTPDNNLVTFDLSASVDVYEKTSSQPIRSYHLNFSHPITNACFLNNQLYFMDSHKTIYTLVQSNYQETKDITPTTTNGIPPLPPPPSTKHHHHHHLPCDYKDNDRFIQYLSETPSHMLPPVKTWVLSYLNTLQSSPL